MNNFLLYEYVADNKYVKKEFRNNGCQIET